MKKSNVAAGIYMQLSINKLSLNSKSSFPVDIVPVPLKQKYIKKNSLHGAVKGVEKNEVPVAKIIYSKCGERPLDDLKNYCKSKNPYSI